MPRHIRFALIATAFAAALSAALISAQGGAAPRPHAVFGFDACADYQLATYEQAETYFRQLAARSAGRMQVVDIGRTVQGRVEIMAVISSPQNLQRLDRLKAIARSLALTRENGAPLTDARARELSQEGTAVVWIDFGLHSSEVAPAQAAPLLAYHLVTDDSPETTFIRDNVVVLLVPNMNPDGTTMVARWYRQQRGRPWEGTPPELWHVYAGHDDNRDWYMMTQPETRNAARQLYGEWFPQIVYDQHQSGPFPARIFVPPFDDPMNPDIPPLVMRGVNAVGDAITRRLDREGKRGAVSRVGFDAWWNGGMRTVPYFHNMIGILTETSHASATPRVYDPQTFPKTFANGASTSEPSAFYPSPFQGGEWHLRDSCAYIVTASLAVLDIGARRREEWLYDSAQLARENIAAHVEETYVVPADQWDPGTAVKLVNVLRLGGVEVERARTAFAADGRAYPAGSYLIRGGQPFEPYVRDLLTRQVYPDIRQYPDGPPKRPYDITGWTLSVQMGVRVDHVDRHVEVASDPVDIARVPDVAAPRAVDGFLALDPRANDAFRAVNRLLAAGAPVYRTATAIETTRGTWPAGSFLISVGAADSTVVQAGTAFGVQMAGVSREVARAFSTEATAWRLHRPRIGVYHAWGGNMDEGWTRWVLEQFEFPYAQVHDADVRAGRLHDRFDAIVLPSATAAQMIDGLQPGAMPEEYTGGMTTQGVANLRAFVEEGGTLVALDSAAELAIQALSLPVTDVTARTRPTDFFVPGSLLQLSLDVTEPIAYGMPPEAAAFFARSPAFDVHGDSARIAASYPGRDLLLSGWLLGASVLAGRAAVVDATVGRGRAVLLGFRTQHRGQSHGTFKLLFNALLAASSDRAALPVQIAGSRPNPLPGGDGPAGE
jgi:hypothetical protein